MTIYVEVLELAKVADTKNLKTPLVNVEEEVPRVSLTAKCLSIPRMNSL